MSGSDLAPLGKHGPAELRKILTWAKSRKRGAILIIDEAEAALGRRLRKSGEDSDASLSTENNSMEGFARDSLNVLLSLTGSASCELMLILTTSNPQALDEAVLDRMDELLEVRRSESRSDELRKHTLIKSSRGADTCNILDANADSFLTQPTQSAMQFDSLQLQLPNTGDRLRIIKDAFKKRFGPPLANDRIKNSISSWWKGRYADSRVQTEITFDVKSNIERLSSDDLTQGCSGRELDKLIQSVATNVYGDVNGNGILTQYVWTSCTQSYCSDLNKKWALLKVKDVNGKSGKRHAIPGGREDIPELSLN